MPEHTLDLDDDGVTNELIPFDLDGNPRFSHGLPGSMKSVFTSSRFETTNNILREFRRLQGKAREHLAKQREVELDEVPWPIGTLHDCRKTFGTVMKNHVSPDVLRRLMGHADIKTTLEYYTGQTEQDAERVRAALDGISGRAQDAPPAQPANKTAMHS